MTDGGTDTGPAGGAGDAGLTVAGSGAEVAPGLVGRDGCREDFAPDNSADDGDKVGVGAGASIAIAAEFVFSAGGSLAGEGARVGEDVTVFA